MAAQALQLAALPLISGYAIPATFGVYVLFMGVCAVASLLAGLRYDAAIVVARHDREAARVARLVLTLGLLTGLLALVVGWPALRQLAHIPDMQAGLLAGLGATYIVANTVVRIVTNWLSRLLRFGWVGAIQFCAVASMVALQLAFLAVGVDALVSLVAGFALAQVVAAAVGIGSMAGARRWLGKGRRRDLLAAARRHAKFPRYMILYGLNSTLRERWVHLVLGWGAGATALGHFAMVQRVVAAPHSFIHAGVGSALLSHARHVSRGEAARIAASLIELSGLLLTPVMVFLAFNADALSAAFFGPAWAGVGSYVPWLAAAYLTLACTGFIDRLFELYGQQGAALRLDLAFSVAMLAALLLASVPGQGVVMGATFAMVYLVYEVIWTWRAHRVNEMPLVFLRRAALVFVSQLVFWSLVSWLLLGLDSLTARAAVSALVMVVVIASHHQWLGGREVVRRLFGKVEALA